MFVETLPLGLRSSMDAVFMLDFEMKKVVAEKGMNFITMASHELRSPLSTMLLSINLLEKYKDKGDDEKMSKQIQRMKVAIDNMRNTLEYFLTAGKQEENHLSVPLERIDSASFYEDIEAVIKEQEPHLKPGQKIVFKNSGDQSIDINKCFLKNIMLNLISNAIKYSFNNSKITVICHLQANELIISVQDHGIGISEEDQQKLFGRFFRAKNSKNIPGTGMGLHIVAKYLELLKGKIEIESRLDEGTCFTVRIPRGQN